MKTLHKIEYKKFPQLNDEQYASIWSHLQDYGEWRPTSIWVSNKTGEVSYNEINPGDCTMDHAIEWYDAGKPEIENFSDFIINYYDE